MLTQKYSEQTKNLFDITGKVALITGGAGLLGTKHAEAIAQHGGIPIIADINVGAATALSDTITRLYRVDSLPVEVLGVLYLLGV